MADVSEGFWLFRFIMHDYSVPLDLLVSQRVVHNRAKTSCCHNDPMFKKLPFNQLAMELQLPHDSLLSESELDEREKLRTSYCDGKKLDWYVSSLFLDKLQNEGLSDLHEILHAPIL